MIRDKEHILSEHNYNAAHIKRFIERWMADDVFRQKYTDNICAAAEQYDVYLSAAELSALCENTPLENLQQHSDLMKWYCAEHQRGVQYKQHLQNTVCAPENTVFKKWRARQIRRCNCIIGSFNQEIMHLPVVFELSSGCSVGCWFCSLNSAPLSDVFKYTDKNIKLWRRCLSVLKDIIGDAVATSICYWATEPLDNPDYEQFCNEFFNEIGYYPATTTAVADKFPERIRNILKSSQDTMYLGNKFSVLSLDQFHAIHTEYSADELSRVSLALQNKESLHYLASSGRARNVFKTSEKNQSDHSKTAHLGSQINELHSTNTCVSGFLINMCEKTVQLITPCNASDHWPLGYKIIAQGMFDTAEDLKLLVEQMIKNDMKISLTYSDILFFHSELVYTDLENGFSVSSPHMTLTFSKQKWYKMIGELISEKKYTAGQISVKVADEFHVHEAQIFQVLNTIYTYGILDEEKTVRTY